MPIFFQGYRTFSHAAPAERLSTVSSPFLSCYFFAGVLARSGKVKESVDLLLKDKKDDIDRILIAAQVLLEKGDVSGSIAILEKLPSSVKHRTGLLSSMVNFFFQKIEKIKLSKRGTTFSDMDARRWHFLGYQRVELKARPFFLLALRAGRPR